MSTSPVEARLEQLCAQWSSYVERADARLLIWTAEEEEEAFIDAFLARESEDEGACTPDLFVQLSRSFDEAAGHGVALTSELLELYQQALKLPAAADLERWCCPSPSESNDDIDFFVSALASFRLHLIGPDSPSKLAVVLQPDHVRAWSDYLLWLQRLVQKAPSELRFLVIDARTAPQYAPLAAKTEQVIAQSCALGVFTALEELAAAEQDESPGGEYRRLQTQCASKLAAGELDGAKQIAARASALATAEGWPHLAAVPSFMLAGAFMAHGKPNEALAAYAEAETLGAQRRALEEKDLTEPAYGTRIRLQARLGQGAVLLSCAAYKLAVTAYGQAAELAHELADAPSELDALRLASFCHAQLGEVDAAWEVGLRGVSVGVAMDDEKRGNSTLPYLGDHLLRVAEHHGAYAAQKKPLEERFVRLLGRNWRDAIAKAS